MHNFDIKEELQRQNSEGAMVDTVTKVLGEMVDNFGYVASLHLTLFFSYFENYTIQYVD